MVLTGLALLSSCASSKSETSAPVAGSQSAGSQSVAEYDVATDLWLNRGQPRKAMEHALRAQQLDEDNAEAAHLVALLYLDFCRRDVNECRLAEAERSVRSALEANPELREAQNTLGVVLIHRRKYPEAIVVLRKLTEDILYLTPENAWGNLGLALLELGQLEPAIDALRRSTTMQPAFCVGHYRLGRAYELKKDLASAHAAYTRALQVEHPLCKSLQDAYAARGKVAQHLGRQDEAAVDLEKCVRLAKHTETGRVCSAALGAMK